MYIVHMGVETPHWLPLDSKKKKKKTIETPTDCRDSSRIWRRCSNRPTTPNSFQSEVQHLAFIEPTSPSKYHMTKMKSEENYLK